MSKHTPGPWTAKMLANYAEPGWVIQWADKGGQHMRRLDYKGNFVEPDARLIAAAPELLALLIKYVDNENYGKPLTIDDMEAAETLIEKLQGDEI